MRKFASILLAVSLLAASAQAGTMTIWTGSIYQIDMEFTELVGDGSESLQKSVLTVTNISGDGSYDPNVFDGVAPSAGYTGFTGLMHQQAIGSSPTLDVETIGVEDNVTATDIDSHFMVLSGDLSIVTAPSETTLVAPSAEASDATGFYAGAPFFLAGTSFGDSLTGAFGDGTASGPLWTFAQIVHNAPVGMFFKIFGYSGGEVVEGFVPIVPEPATMSLLGLGGLAALIRRKK